VRTPVIALDELAEATATAVEVGAHRLVLVRLGDDVYCLDDHCSHEDFPLSSGEVLADLREIECDRHGATFRLSDGAACSLPATKPVATYEVHVVDGMVEVDL
jgi:3-phenylpropionate/trans-cinnamate dioxygenase ferredoxin component